jgi:glycerophosphoryl diester phosphodiesterase
MLAWAAQGVAASTDWTRFRTLNIAHQGGEDEAPSNTMYALERSLRLGADMLELDVHTTADEELVVIHDDTVDRTTNGSGSVYDMTLREIQALDAAHNFVPGEGTVAGRPRAHYPFRGVRLGEREPPPGFRARDFRIPTLREVLTAYPDVPTNIEIKGRLDLDLLSFHRNAEALARLLGELGRTEGIVVASFNDLALLHFRRLMPGLDLAPGIVNVAGYKFTGLPLLPGTAVFQVPLAFEGLPVADAPFVERARRDGFGVHVWTINAPPTMKLLLRWGVDGIMTAEPARLERVLCKAGVPRPRRPAGFPGRHCNPRASIACDVRAMKAVRAGKRLRVTLRRHDDFEGPCAGTVKLRRGRGPVLKRSFRFGWTPPRRGGPRAQRVRIPLGSAARDRSRAGRVARLTVRPYMGFARGQRIRLARPRAG